MKTKREIYGFMHNGERVYIGHSAMSDDDAQSFLDKIAAIYAEPKQLGAFIVGSAVFNARAFIAVQITPLLEYDYTRYAEPSDHPERTAK